MSSPYLLYPSAFLTPWDASAVVNSLDNIVYNEYKDLQAAVKSLHADPNKFTDFQKVIFNANYDVRLQPSGYPGFNRDAGVDLYNELSVQQSYDIATITDELNRPAVHYVIQPLNIKESSIDLHRLDSPIIYISSPYSVAKAISNISNKGDRFSFERDYSGGYMMSYWDDAGYQSVISGQIPGRDGKLTTEVYYPLSSANESKSISINTGEKDDFVLFDNSHSQIKLNDGDDTVAPAAAAFLPSIQFGKNIIKSIGKDLARIKSGSESDTQSSRYKYSLAGNPIERGNNDYANNTATPQKNLSRLLNGYVNQGTGKTYQFGYASTNWYATKTDITDAEQEQNAINIGGQRIYGGPGNDVLYGFDPLLYAKMSALETASSNNANGPLSLKFLNNEKTDINWTPILLSGGEGLDNFFIGDLGKINLRGGKVNSSHPNGSTLYTLLGDKNSLDDVIYPARIQQSWGDGLSADSYNLIASYNYTTEVIQKGISLDYSTNGEIDPFKAAQVGRKSAKAIIDVAKVFKKSFPAIEAAVSVMNLGIQIASTFPKPTSATTNKFYREELTQSVVPPGSWNQVITIPDWDPLDRFTIQTIPIEDPNIKEAKAWENVKFSIRWENNSSMTPQNYGYVLEMETAVGGKSPFAFLTGLQSPNNGAEYGYQTYNFFTGKQRKIDPITDITYFGVLANTDGAEKIRTSYVEDSYGGLRIDKDASLFLWDSPTLRREGLLDQYRSAASNIQVGVDTRKFGWYTDLKYNSSEIDLFKSTFNYWDRDSSRWVSISLREFTKANPKSKIGRLAEKAKFTYWTVQDTYANQLMNLSAATAVNTNDLEFYKSRDDGSVRDPLTGEWIQPGAEGYEKAALSDDNYAGAFSLRQANDGSIEYIIEDGYKLSPFIETTSIDGSKDYIFVYSAVHANDPEHTKDSMVRIDDTGVIFFEDMIGGDYNYNDVVFEPTRDPALAALIASAIYNK